MTVHEVAASIGAGLARAALAGRVDGVLVDTSFVIANDAALAIITDKDADGLDMIRHSTAHLLAYALSQVVNPANAVHTGLRADLGLTFLNPERKAATGTATGLPGEHYGKPQYVTTSCPSVRLHQESLSITTLSVSPSK